MLKFSSVLIFALASACTGATEPTLPADTFPLPVPASFALWWRQTEACSGLRGDFSRITWFITNRNGPFRIDGVEYDGYWFGSSNRILLAHDVAHDGRVVRHEMLHALLKGGNHPREFFINRCGAQLGCTVGCDALGEAGRGVPASAVVVPASTLRVGLVVEPVQPSVRADSGWFQLIVSVTNPRDEPIWVPLTDCPYFGCVTFGYVYASSTHTGTVAVSRESRMGFRARETRRYAFDDVLPPGIYELIATFELVSTPRYALTVTP